MPVVNGNRIVNPCLQTTTEEISVSLMRNCRLHVPSMNTLQDFIRSPAFATAVKFLMSRPENELVVRLTGELTELTAARSLHETIDANKLGNVLSVLCEPPKPGEILFK